jgi:RHS repeat-associated protein
MENRVNDLPNNPSGGLESINGPWANDTFNYIPGALTGSRNWANDANAIMRTESATADLLGRLTASTSGTGLQPVDLTSVQYGPANYSSRPQTSTINGIQTAYAFHPATAGTKAFALQSLTYSGTGLQPVNHAYDYDNRGNLTTWNQTSNGKTRNNTYTHSRTDELTDALQTDATTGATLTTNTYRYDAAGNRITSGAGLQPASLAQHNNRNQLKTVGGAGTTLVEGTVDEKSKVTVNGLPAKMNAISGTGLWKYERQIDVTAGTNAVAISATDASGNTRTQSYNFTVGPLTQTLTYDLNGNMLTDGARTYTWDAADRLLAISSGTHLTEFTYDGMSRRVKIVEKESGSIVTAKRYQWEGYTILAELNDSTGAIEKQYYSHGFDILTGPQIVKYYYLRDHLGSIREVLDASRNVRATYDYDPYGQRTKMGGDVDADFGFTGHYTHAASGLLLAPFRAYDPKLGRWISEDPIGERGGMNLYAFARNSPTRWTDSLGLEPDGIGIDDSGWPAVFRLPYQALKKLNNLPNTILGIGIGLTGCAMGGKAPHFGNNAIEFEDNPLMTMGALTIGNVIHYGPGTSPTADGNHERQHTYQGEVLGGAYLPFHIFSAFYSYCKAPSGHPDPTHYANPLEEGPMDHPPRPWPIPWRMPLP